MKNKKRKSLRFRGARTHGYGSHKKHRGAGHRGGRGNAGSGKRADTNKPKIWKDTKYFGKFGFKTQNKKIVSINIQQLEKLTKNTTIDLNKLGYNKLLATGSPKTKYVITVQYASKSAIEKIKNAGGDVILQ